MSAKGGARLSIVIPTRQRADTLSSALATCTSQSYDDLEIVVCDNASSDATRDIVNAAGDARVKYVHTGRRLSMSDNFNFAFGHVTGDFVFYLGDDDGLVPHAACEIAELIAREQVAAVSWHKAEFIWPQDGVDGGWLHIPFNSGIYRYRSATVLRHALTLVKNRLWFPWTRLPVIMNSFVNVDALKRLCAMSENRLFWSSQPDVYSGFAALRVMDDYLFSLRPYSVNGASRHSNGRAGSEVGLKARAAEEFSRENEGSVAMNLGQIHVRGSILSCVLEAAYYANRYVYGGTLRLDYQRFANAVFNELASARSEIYQDSMSLFLRICREVLGVNCSPARIQSRYANHPQHPSLPLGVTDRGGFALRPAALGVRDVHGAAVLVHHLLPPSAAPTAIAGYQPLARLAAAGYRMAERAVWDRAL
jgi:glycosyltransferase involved in cell wall biosynthesis